MPDNWFVVVMGVGAVFAVLILIIGMCWLIGLLCREKKPAETSAPAPTAPVAPATIANRGELAAAIAAAVSEYTGTDTTAIRIVSIKKI